MGYYAIISYINYYKNDIQYCIPIKSNHFENYKKFDKECINK